MGRRATGSVRWLRNALTGKPQWHARFSTGERGPNGKMKRTKYIPIGASIPEHDREGALADAARWAPKARAASPAGAETVEGYAGRWLKAREGRVKSLRSDKGRLERHVLPVLGPLDVRTFTRDDVERLRDRLDDKIAARSLSWKTAANVWTVVTSMADDMVNAKRRELRVRGDNPCKDVRPPERGARKAKQYLYPSEFLAFVRCERVPLSWRRAVAIAVYTFARDGELRALDWGQGDVDLEHGVLSITRAYSQGTRQVEQTKTGDTRRLPIEPALLPLLRAMHEAMGGKGPILKLDVQNNMARRLRVYLRRAGVSRAELHEATPTRKAMTAHDLRATGITWAAVRGDDAVKIKQRAGHRTLSTTEGYIREAENLREGFGDVFPPLPPELLGNAGKAPGRGGKGGSGQLPRNRHLPSGRAERAENKLVAVPKEGLEPSTETSTEPEKLAAGRDPAAAPIATARDVSPGPLARTSAVASPPATSRVADAELERAIVEAVTHGALDVARALAAQLEERRRANARNVVPIRHRPGA